jgi:nitrogen fixation protein NifU and related proteins
MNLYQQQILDLYKNPHNFGALTGATCSHRAFNPLCGDDITMHLVTDGDQDPSVATPLSRETRHLPLSGENVDKKGDRIITDVSWEGNGCAISMAAASLMTDAMKGKTIDEVLAIDKETLLEWMGIEIGPVRLKCALLSLEAAHEVVSISKSNS